MDEMIEALCEELERTHTDINTPSSYADLARRAHVAIAMLIRMIRPLQNETRARLIAEAPNSRSTSPMPRWP